MQALQRAAGLLPLPAVPHSSQLRRRRRQHRQPRVAAGLGASQPWKLQQAPCSQLNTNSIFCMTPAGRACRRVQPAPAAAAAAAGAGGPASGGGGGNGEALPPAALAQQAGSTSSSTDSSSKAAFSRVVLPTALALLLCNMDRMCLRQVGASCCSRSSWSDGSRSSGVGAAASCTCSVAMLPIARELGWAPGTQGVVQSAFLWGYLATQLLGGTLADKYGGKLVMGVGVAWFSLASMLLPAVAVTPWTAAAGITLPAVLAARFLVGFGEGVALPAMNNLIARNVDPAQKATALGSVFTGFHTGNLVGLLLSPLILQHFGWRALFYLFGLAGGPLLLLWTLVVPSAAKASSSRGGGSSSSSGSAASGATTAGSSSRSSVGVGRLLSSSAVWAIIVANFVNHWGYFIYLNWMPTYFVKVLGMDLRASSLMSFVPWMVMAFGSSAAGLLADGLVRRGVPVLTVRKRIQTVAFLGPVLALMVLANRSIMPPLALLCMTAALGITSLGQAGFVANMSDIAPRHAGLLFGLCNTFGSFAGILGVSVCGFVLEKTGSFSLIFQATAALYVLGTLVWNACCRAEPQFD